MAFRKFTDRPMSCFVPVFSDVPCAGMYTHQLRRKSNLAGEELGVSLMFYIVDNFTGPGTTFSIT